MLSVFNRVLGLRFGRYFDPLIFLTVLLGHIGVLADHKKLEVVNLSGCVTGKFFVILFEWHLCHAFLDCSIVTSSSKRVA